MRRDHPLHRCISSSISEIDCNNLLWMRPKCQAPWGMQTAFNMIGSQPAVAQYLYHHMDNLLIIYHATISQSQS